MKAKKLLFFYFLIGLILPSCEGDVPAQSGEEIRLSATIEGLKTRASGSTWDKGDAIGVYMKKSGEALSSSAIALNVEYQTTGDATFSPAGGAPTITFPLDGSAVDFIGYYPYKEDIANFIYPIDLSDQSVQSNIDILYSDNAKGFRDDNPEVNMSFSHQLSKIVLIIEHKFMPDLSGIEVIMTNVTTKANFNLIDGQLSESSANDNIACMVAPDGATAEAILLPSSSLEGIELWFVLDDETFKYPLSSASQIESFEKSTRYTYNVYLDSERIPVVTLGTISDWIEGPSYNATVPPTSETPPRMPGSKRDPYTVAEAQANQGKMGVWVEGFIVGYFSSTSMNSFSTDFSVIEEVSRSNFALATNQGETDIAHIMPVQLGSSNIRNELNLRDHPDHFNKKVKIRGDLDSYFSAPGLRDIKQYEFIEPE